MSLRRLSDEQVVEAFVAHLRNHGHSGLVVDLRPDQENAGDIDAIAGPFAIEHTSVDSVREQTRDAAAFLRAVGALQADLRGQLGFRLNLTVAYDAVRVGQDWEEIQRSIRAWILGDAPSLVDGHHVIADVPGIPFDLHVRKQSDCPPGLFTARYSPADDDLATRFREAVGRKNEKLGPYRDHGKTTVLLIENADVALMCWQTMFAAARTAFPDGLPDGLDHLWFVDTSIPDDLDWYEFTPGLAARLSDEEGVKAVWDAHESPAVQPPTDAGCQSSRV